MKNMLDTMEVLGVDPQDDLEPEATNSSAKINIPNSSASGGSSSGPRKAITAGPLESTELASSEKSGKKSKGLTAEQKRKLATMQEEQEKVRKQRVVELSKRLLEKVSVWTETDRSQNVTEAFKIKMQVSPSL
jgi:hypothetical protein